MFVNIEVKNIWFLPGMPSILWDLPIFSIFFFEQEDKEAHDKFLKINRAYEVLKDEDLRKKYDTYGEDGLKEDGPTGRGYQSWNFYQQNFGMCRVIRLLS